MLNSSSTIRIWGLDISLVVFAVAFTSFSLAIVSQTQAQPDQPKITVLYDAFGKESKMIKDWGFSALIEHKGKRILFDTGQQCQDFRA